MLIHKHLPQQARRAGFTLIEVLVVVTIVVILASVGTVATLQYLEGAKEDNAKLNMQQLEQAAKAWSVKNYGVQLTNIGDLVVYLENGQSALVDPWGQPYQFRYQQTDGVNERIIFFTTHGKTGVPIEWPNIQN